MRVPLGLNGAQDETQSLTMGSTIIQSPAFRLFVYFPSLLSPPSASSRLVSHASSSSPPRGVLSPLGPKNVTGRLPRHWMKGVDHSERAAGRRSISPVSDFDDTVIANQIVRDGHVARTTRHDQGGQRGAIKMTNHIA